MADLGDSEDAAIVRRALTRTRDSWGFGNTYGIEAFERLMDISRQRENSIQAAAKERIDNR